MHLAALVPILLSITAAALASRSTSSPGTDDRAAKDSAPLERIFSVDAFAEDDPRDLLSAAQLQQSFSAEPTSRTVGGLSRELAFEYSVHVYVRLVGYDGGGRFGAKLSKELLFEYLNELLSDHPISTMDERALGGREELPVRARYIFTVEHAPSSLLKKLNVAVGSAVERSGVAAGETATLPHSVVDSLVQADHQRHALSYTVYLLNPGPFARKYTYQSDAAPARSQRGGANVLGGHGRCATCQWLGAAGSDGSDGGRYTWIDVGAQCPELGRSTPSEGGVSLRMLPLLTNHASLAELKAAGWKWPGLPQRERREAELLADMAAYIGRTSDMLISPSMMAITPFEREPSVLLKVITDHPGSSDHVMWWGAVTKQLGSLGLPQQTTSFSVSEVTFADCAECVAAFHHSMRVGGSAARVRHQGGKAASPKPSWMLDSKELYSWLQHYSSAQKSRRGRQGWAGHGKALTIYLFDLEKESHGAVLLDGVHQAVSFPDMVIAVRTKPVALPAPWRCGLAGDKEVHSRVDASAVARPVLAATVMSLWGVAPPHRRWSAVHNASQDEMLWAAPSSPWTPLSSDLQLSFSTRDAARRNLVLSEVTLQLHEIRAALARHDEREEPSELIAAAGWAQFSQRWALIRHKLDTCRTELYLNHHALAFYYARSIKHDARELDKLMLEFASSKVRTMDCSAPVVESGTNWSAVALLSLVVGGFCWRRSL